MAVTLDLYKDRVDVLLRKLYDHDLIEGEPYYKGMLWPVPEYQRGDTSGQMHAFNIMPRRFLADHGSVLYLRIPVRQEVYLILKRKLFGIGRLQLILKRKLFGIGRLQLTVLERDVYDYYRVWSYPADEFLRYIGEEYYSAHSVSSAMEAIRKKNGIKSESLKWKIARNELPY